MERLAQCYIDIDRWTDIERWMDGWMDRRIGEWIVCFVSIFSQSFATAQILSDIVIYNLTSGNPNFTIFH